MPVNPATMAALNLRGAALESSYFHTEQKNTVERYMERMVREGKLPQALLEALDAPASHGAPCLWLAWWFV